MKNTFDLSEFVPVLTEQSVVDGLVEREKRRRKELCLTQKKLSMRSGVSYASVRRFESTGEISLSSLIKIAHAIDCLDDFDELFKHEKITNLKEYKGK